MSINSRASVALTTGFIVSMVGLFDIFIGVLIFLFLDGLMEPPNEGVFGLTIGQLVGVLLILSSIFIFFYGRHMGWKPQSQTGLVGKGSNASNNPVKRM
ncbi:MAG: hypothetical protein K0S54_2799 [Alphaproteobacteria bacterium]|nr:hypothetical protein [Alphaproteobacteria bacterium]